LKIEVKKKIDVIFDCRTAQRSPESHFRVETQSQIGKKILERCENALMLAALSDVRTILMARNFRRKRKSERWKRWRAGTLVTNYFFHDDALRR
jgi:hypothetical protein